MPCDSLPPDPRLIASDTTTLFQTTAWRDAWLATWGAELATRPTVRQDRCHGLYHHSGRLKKLIPVTTTAPLGVPIPGVRSIRSEYGCWIDDLDELIRHAGDQLVLPDVVTGSAMEAAIQRAAAEQRCLCLPRDSALAYAVATDTHAFSDYLADLSSNTRRQLFNQRTKLAGLGQVSLTTERDPERAIECLNRFHRQRWNKPCYGGTNLAFIRELTARLQADGHGVIWSVLCLDDEPVSALFDVVVDGRRHNVQAGFETELPVTVSLGSLHLGYALEEAFADPAIDVYDFMAGRGRRTDYKARLANRKTRLNTWWVIKSAWLKPLYRLRTRLQSTPPAPE